MSLQMSDLKALLDHENIHYFEDPRRNVVLANFDCRQGSYQLTICLDVDGELGEQPNERGVRGFRFRR